MTPDEFNLVVSKQLTICHDVLCAKADEYATDMDRLHNFKIAAKLNDISTARALGGMMAKHTVSVYDMINSGETYSPELWQEKITDHMNYLILLTAIISEETVPNEPVISTNSVKDAYLSA